MNNKDFALDENGDLLIINGDFVIEDSSNQNIEDILNSYKGYYKEFPFLGVGIFSYIRSTGRVLEMKNLIKLQLESDGFRVNKINIIDLEKMEIEIDAERII